VRESPMMFSMVYFSAISASPKKKAPTPSADAGALQPV